MTVKLNKKLISIEKLISENSLYKVSSNLVELKKEYGMIFPVRKIIRRYKHLVIEKGRFDQKVKVEELLDRNLNTSESNRIKNIGTILGIMYS